MSIYEYLVSEILIDEKVHNLTFSKRIMESYALHNVGIHRIFVVFMTHKVISLVERDMTMHVIVAREDLHLTLSQNLDLW